MQVVYNDSPNNFWKTPAVYLDREWEVQRYIDKVSSSFKCWSVWELDKMWVFANQAMWDKFVTNNSVEWNMKLIPWIVLWYASSKWIRVQNIN